MGQRSGSDCVAFATSDEKELYPCGRVKGCSATSTSTTPILMRKRIFYVDRGWIVGYSSAIPMRTDVAIPAANELGVGLSA